MRVSRDLPDDLVTQVRRARAVEATAETLIQERNAVAATGTLMLAAVDAGWKIVDIARAMGLRPSTASRRVRDARERRAGAPLGLAISEPSVIRGPLGELETPLTDRQWLSRAEPADYLGVDGRTIHDYFKTGLLPNSRKLSASWRLYLRADLDRVRNGPRRGVYLDRAALREALNDERSPLQRDVSAFDLDNERDPRLWWRVGASE